MSLLSQRFPTTIEVYFAGAMMNFRIVTTLLLMMAGLFLFACKSSKQQSAPTSSTTPKVKVKKQATTKSSKKSPSIWEARKGEKVLGMQTVKGLKVVMGRGKRGLFGEVFYFRTNAGKKEDLVMRLKKVVIDAKKKGVETVRYEKETTFKLAFEPTKQTPYKTDITVTIEKRDDEKSKRVFVFKNIPVK